MRYGSVLPFAVNILFQQTLGYRPRCTSDLEILRGPCNTEAGKGLRT